jgi:hypothetical protein
MKKFKLYSVLSATRLPMRIYFSILTDKDCLNDDWVYNQSDVKLNVTYTN